VEGGRGIQVEPRAREFNSRVLVKLRLLEAVLAVVTHKGRHGRWRRQQEMIQQSGTEGEWIRIGRKGRKERKKRAN